MLNFSFLSQFLTLSAIALIFGACEQSTRQQESNSSDAILWTTENGCGIHKDVFYVKLTQARLDRRMTEIRRFHAIDSLEFSEELKIEQGKIQAISERAFANKELREPRHRQAFELLNGPNVTEECVYVKLRIAEEILD